MARPARTTALRSSAARRNAGAWLRLLGALLPLPLAAQGLPPPPESPAPAQRYEYDAHGNLQRVVRAPGAGDLGTTHLYDRLHRPVQSLDARNRSTQLGYDGRDALTQVTDPRSLVTRYARSGLGEVGALVSPDTGTATLGHDAAGNLLTRLDSRGVLATYSHDAMNRLTGIVYSHPELGVQRFGWTYDQVGAGFSHGIGRLTSVQYPAGGESFAHDAEGRVVRAVQTIVTTSATVTKAVGYGYDTAGRLTSITYPSGRVLGIVHGGGLPVALHLTAGTTTLPLVGDLSFQPSPGGAGPAQGWAWILSDGTGLRHDRSFDLYGRMVRYPLGGAVRDLRYDAADRITHYTHLEAASGTATAAAQALDQSFAYDELDRLTAVLTPQGSWAFGYDDNGNRTGTTYTPAGSTPRSRAYTVAPTSNRLLGLSSPARSMSHDAAGNTVSDLQGFVGYTAWHDAAGRLAQLESSVNGSTVETTQYGYNHEGLRVLKFPTSAQRCTGTPRTCTAQTPPRPTVYVHDTEGRLLGEYDGLTGAVRREYVWLGSMPLAFVDGSTSQHNVFYIHTDHLDTPRVVLDRQGRQRWSWMAEPFGNSAPVNNPLGLGAVTFNLRMPGQYFDRESGLLYNGWRVYDAGVGRYSQSDPIGLVGGINTYAYVENRPTMLSDPLGLDSMCGPGQMAVRDPRNPGGQVFVCRPHPTESQDRNTCVTGECAAGVPPTPKPNPTACEIECGIGSNDAAGRALVCKVVSEAGKAFGIPGIPLTLACKWVDKRICLKECKEREECPQVSR